MKKYYALNYIQKDNTHTRKILYFKGIYNFEVDL